MKRYIRSSWGDYPEYDSNEWSDRDVELHKSIDWKSRNYEDYPVEGETFRANCRVYGLGDEVVMVPATFQLMIRPNSRFAPYYVPTDVEKVKADACRMVGVKRSDTPIVGPMYDGRNRGMYNIHDRLETQELYDVLST